MLTKTIEEMTLADLQSLKNAIGKINEAGFSLPAIGNKNESNGTGPYDHLISRPVFLRTVTMYYTGRLLEVYPYELVISEAAWIPDTGRFYDALSKGEFSEVEPYVADKVVIGRGAILDVCEWKASLPRNQK